MNWQEMAHGDGWCAILFSPLCDLTIALYACQVQFCCCGSMVCGLNELVNSCKGFFFLWTGLNHVKSFWLSVTFKELFIICLIAIVLPFAGWLFSLWFHPAVLSLVSRNVCLCGISGSVTSASRDSRLAHTSVLVFLLDLNSCKSDVKLYPQSSLTSMCWLFVY